MLELCFSDSAAGALKTALARQNRGKVAPLTLALSVGELSDMGGEMAQRRSALELLFGFMPYAGEVLSELWAQSMRALELLRAAARDAEPVRVWALESVPDELCGLLYACSLLGDRQAPLLLASLPPQTETPNAVTFHRGGGDFPPEALAAQAEQAKPLSPALRQAYAAQWAELVRENAPLRAVVNGRLMGVGEDFYDFALRKNLPQGAFVAAQALGKTLAALPGASDGLLFRRLMNMAACGELIELSPPGLDPPYSGVLRRAR